MPVDPAPQEVEQITDIQAQNVAVAARTKKPSVSYIGKLHRHICQ